MPDTFLGTEVKCIFNQKDKNPCQYGVSFLLGRDRQQESHKMYYKSGKCCRENGVSSVRKLVPVKMKQAGSEVEVGVERVGPTEKLTSEPILVGVWHVSSYWKSFPDRGNSKCKSLEVFKEEEALQGNQREEHRGGEVRDHERP